MPREKSRYRDRRSSSYSSDSSYDRKKLKSKYKKRSRSRDRSESSSHRRRDSSTSRSRHKKRSYSRSLSRDRYESKSKRRSSSRSRSKRDRSRSESRSKTKHSKSSKKSYKRSRSSSRSSSYEKDHSSHRKVNLDDTDKKLEKAIKAAAAAGLTMTKIPTVEYKEVEIKEDMPTIHDRNLLAELNSDSFVPKSFVSSKGKKQSQNIVIDLNAETITVPESDVKVQTDDSIINFDEIPSEEELREMWIKKLYTYRKKMLKDEL